MGLKRFEIILDNDVIVDGQEISGVVIVELDKLKKMKHLRIEMLGRGKTEWQEGQSAPAPNSNKKEKKNIGGGSSYSSEEEYFCWDEILFGVEDGKPVNLPAGEHQFRFKVSLPEDGPSSFEGVWGSIRYSAKAVIHRPWKFDHEVKSMFTVLEVEDLNENPDARQPIKETECKDMLPLFRKRGELTVTATMPQTGFVGGQSLGLKLAVKCSTPHEFKCVSAQVQQVATFAARRGRDPYLRKEVARFAAVEHSELIVGAGECVSAQAQQVATFAARRGRDPYLRKEVVRFAAVEHSELIFGAGEEEMVDFSTLKLPALVTGLRKCHIIDVYYDVVINLDPSRDDSDLEFRIPINVGTVPLVLSGDLYYKIGHKYPRPSYRDCVFGRQNTLEDGDSEFIIGEKEFAPKYPVYDEI